MFIAFYSNLEVPVTLADVWTQIWKRQHTRKFHFNVTTQMERSSSTGQQCLTEMGWFMDTNTLW